MKVRKGEGWSKLGEKGECFIVKCEVRRKVMEAKMRVN